MAKRNIMFTKPDEPAFLKRMKNEIGFKETCSIETKFEDQPTGPGDDSDGETEKPQVVVLKPGDLTEQEAEDLRKKLEEESNNKPADLNERVIFNRTKKESKPEKGKKESTKNKPQVKLSFADDDDEEDGDADEGER